jgi:myo-inositol catabolism protein IolC
MSYFSRHLVYGPPEPNYKIIVSKQVESKTGVKRLMPVITFYHELDPDQIIEQANTYLTEKYGPDWSEKNKYHLEIIPPEEEE